MADADADDNTDRGNVFGRKERIMNQIITPLTLAIVSAIAIALMSIMAKLDFIKEDIETLKKEMEKKE